VGGRPVPVSPPILPTFLRNGLDGGVVAHQVEVLSKMMLVPLMLMEEKEEKMLLH
jgi:hypothetical protein